ncbi:MAG: transpeptidase family protein [Bacteroidia bacterium]|nr:transpeptidase family protein [Bacteroidia bacterium]
MAIRKDILIRFIIIYWTVFLFAVAIIARIVFLQFAEGEKWKTKALSISQRDIIILANRGDICDADGKTLASSVPFYEIHMDMKADGLDEDIFNENIDSLSFCLADFFKNKSKDEYKKELVRGWKKGERNVLIKKRVSYSELKQIKQFPIFRLGRNRGGFIAIQKDKRVKPFNILASRTIGYLREGEEGETGEKTGFSGIEGAYDHELKGTKGLKLVQKSSGNIWMPISDANEIEPKDGRDIITTIDVNLQDVAETALMKQLKLSNADWGTVILMEVKNGEIKAVANLQRDSSGNYGEYFNYAIGASVEPGSIFKLPSLVVALEDGYVNLTDTFDTEGGVKYYYNKPMKDSHKGGGRFSVQQIFEMSSNVGVSKIITQYYETQPQKFVDRLYSMKMNSPLGLDIKGEARPVIKSPKDKYWSGLSLPWMSVGYSVQITPLQILTFYNAIANNGKMVKPHFVKAIRYHGQIVKSFEPEIIHPSVCSQQTVEKARKMMEGVVEKKNGTAHRLKNDHIKIAGKTGTAQIAKDNEGYGIDVHSYRASFCGYFPSDNPLYSCIVMINNPRGSIYYGSSLSGPVFREIAELVYAKSLDIHQECEPKENLSTEELPTIKNGYRNYLETSCKALKLKIEKETKAEWVDVKSVNSKIVCLPNFLNSKSKIVPCVVGMGIRDALPLLENNGLRVTTRGRGTIKSQSLEPGTNVNKNDSILIELI